MQNSKSFFKVAVVLFIVLQGCTSKQQLQTAKQYQQASLSAAPEQFCTQGITKTRAANAAEDVLTDMHFDINKKDVELGIITTRPLSGAKFFELWRHDAIGSQNRIESNLHSIRKTARINISRENQQVCINCQVQSERLSIPEHTVTSSAEAYEMFTESGSSLQRLKLHPEQQKKMSWLDAGKDYKLASEILSRIRKQIKNKLREPSSKKEQK